MSSWFYKLRSKRGGGAIAGGEPDDVAKPVAPAPSPCSPNRASYYVPSRERVLLPPPRRPAREDNPRLRDTHFPRSPQPSDDIVFDVVARRRDDHCFKPMPELKLRPILTRHGAASADSTTSAAASPTARVRPRFHVRPPPPSRRRKAAALPTAEGEEKEEACARRRRSASRRLRPWMYETLVVVKDSADPEEDFLESMAEMIAANGVRSPRDLEELLACYLALNAPDHHCAIVAALRRAWVQHLHSGRCMHESRLI